MELDFQRILERLPEEVLVLAPDAPRFTIVAASDAFLRATRTPREAVVGKGVFEVLPDDRDGSDDGMNNLARASLQRVVDERCVDGPHISCHEVRRQEPDGAGIERRYRRSLSSPVMGADGRVACIIHEVQDVTDAVLHSEDGVGSLAADGALRRAEADLAQEISDHGQTTTDLGESRLLLASSLEAQEGTVIFCIDRDYRYLFFNRAHEQVMQRAYGTEPATGACVLDLMTDEEDRAAAKENCDRALAGESHTNVRVFGDVTRAWYESFFNPVRDGSGAIIGATALARDITERRLAEERLRESEDEFRVLAEAVPQIVWTTTPDGKNTYFNQQWVDYTGMSLEESYGDGWNTPFHPDDRERAWEAWQRATRDDAPYSLECRLRRADGAYRWWLVRGAPLRDGSGAILKWFGTCTDIDDLKTAEEALREREFLLSESQQMAHIGSFRWEFETGRLTWTDETFRLFGLAKDARTPSAEALLETVYPDDRSRHGDWMRACMAGEDVAPLDYRLILPDGSVVWHQISGRIERDPAGAPVALVGTNQDITERKLAGAALRESEERYRQLFEGESDAVFLVDNETGRIVEANPAASTLYGYSHEEITALRDLDLVADAERLMSDTRGSPSGRQIANPMIRTHRRKDGTTFPVEITGGFFMQGDRSLRVAAVRDVTEREQAAEDIRRLNAELEERVRARTVQLDAANKELETFAYSVSHDLRAPLRAIDGFSAMVLEDAGDRLEEQDLEHLERVRAAAERMAALIDALLGLSRASRHEMHFEEVDVSGLAEQVIAELREAAPGRCVETIVGSGMRAKTDAVLLRAILANLLSNAWKYTGRHDTARIEVGVTGVAGESAFFVSDDGAGFDMEAAQHLFGPFQRYHGSDDFPGDGIGLATVQRLVARLGGRVWAEAEVEKGATFYFTLPDPTGGF